MKYRLSFTITTEADPSDLLDRLTEYAGRLVAELEPGETWEGAEVPATLDESSPAVVVVGDGCPPQVAALLKAAADVAQWFESREHPTQQGAQLIANLQAAIDATEVVSCR